jgi:class 3 adenylate cyclase
MKKGKVLKNNTYFEIAQTYTQKSLVEILRRGEDPRKLKLRQEQRAVLFSDIRNFTFLSDQLRHEELVEVLNDFFNRANYSVQRWGGEVDKLMGDCVMATFPSSMSAVKAAVDLKLAVQELNKKRIAKGLKKIENGIGIAYGKVTRGNIGSLIKMDYTLIGEVVNLASRLESLTKHYEVGVLISPEVEKEIKADFNTRFIDIVRLKGRNEPLKIYEIFNHEPESLRQKKTGLGEVFSQAFDYYQHGSFIQAQAVYKSLIEEVGPHCYLEQKCADPVLEFYQFRCETLSEKLKRGLLKLRSWRPVQEFV